MQRNTTENLGLQTGRLSQYSSLSNLNNLGVFILLPIVIWVAFYWHHASFGLYVDDHYRTASTIGITWTVFWQKLTKEITFQGRPIHNSLIYLFSFFSVKLGGLRTAYWIGYGITVTTAYLFYTFLRRISNQRFFPAIGALAFCLFPADTNHAWLTHSFALKTSVILFLTAIHCYLLGKKNLSYVVIFGSLLCYETVFPLFLVAPLLDNKWGSKLGRKLIKHVVILAALIVCVIVLRKMIGEGRVADLNPLAAIAIPIRQAIIGPIVSMGMFLYRPIEVLMAPNRELVIFLPLCFASFWWVFSRFKSFNTVRDLGSKAASEANSSSSEFSDFFKEIAKLVLVGLLMLILAYPLTFIGSPIAIHGVGTRIHLAASIGASILFACVCSIILFMAQVQRRRRIATAVLAAYFALLVGFGLVVQQDYKLSWQYQRALLTDIVRLCPDMTNGTAILIEDDSLRKTKYIGSFAKGLPLVISRIYQFPEGWRAPQAYRLRSNWAQEILAETDKTSFQLDGSSTGENSGFAITIESSNVIFLEAKDGKLTRRTEPLVIEGQEFPLKQKTAPTLSQFKKGPLHSYLIQLPDEEPVAYLM